MPNGHRVLTESHRYPRCGGFRYVGKVAAMIRVRVAFRDLSITTTSDTEHYSPDLLADLAERASRTLTSTLVMLDAITDDA